MHGTTGGGGFVQFPGAAFTADPQSLGTYDLAARKWLPVPHAWVAPDGTKYAWPEYRRVSGPATGIIHIVDVASGADRTLTVPAPSMPISWESSGLYIAGAVPFSDAPPSGLSLLDTATGGLRQITPSGAWWIVGTDSAYGADLDPATGAPGSQGPGAANRLRSVRLDTGAISTIQTFPGQQVQLVGVQAANPVFVLTGSGRTQVHIGTSTIYDQPTGSAPPMGPAQLDGTAIWLSGTGAVWHSVAGGQLERIQTPVQVSQVAGACR